MTLKSLEFGEPVTGMVPSGRFLRVYGAGGRLIGMVGFGGRVAWRRPFGLTVLRARTPRIFF